MNDDDFSFSLFLVMSCLAMFEKVATHVVATFHRNCTTCSIQKEWMWHLQMVLLHNLPSLSTLISSICLAVSRLGSLLGSIYLFILFIRASDVPVANCGGAFQLVVEIIMRPSLLPHVKLHRRSK